MTAFSDLNDSDTEEEGPPPGPLIIAPPSEISSSPPPPPPSIITAADILPEAAAIAEVSTTDGEEDRARENLVELLRQAGCLCPIGLHPMVNPVLLASGQTFEQANIDEFFRSRALEQYNANPLKGIGYFCPLTKQSLDPDCHLLAKCCRVRPYPANNKGRRCQRWHTHKCICHFEGVLEWDNDEFAPCKPLMIPNLGVKQACEAIVTREGFSLDFLSDGW